MIAVRITKNFHEIDVSLPRLRKLVRAVCRRFNLSKATVGIAILDDAQIRKLNAQFLNRRRTTDCLSFDLSDDEAPHSPRLFELVVNGQMAVRQAGLRGHSCEAELALYVIHALIHNLGLDDLTPRQARKMHDTEDQILQQSGYGVVYNQKSRRR